MKKKNQKLLISSSFIFNLGRLWQETISENWEESLYLFELIKEVTPQNIINKYSKELQGLDEAIKEQDIKKVDLFLEKILKW